MAIFDISQLSEQNPWWVDKQKILQDFHLTKLDKLLYKWDPSLRQYINLGKDSIYTIRGPRQVGKTTLIKLIIKELLFKNHVKPEDIFFWTCETNDSKELGDILKTYLDWRNISVQRKYIFLDEICAVKDWNKEIIHLANKGALQNVSMILTGSHSMDLKHSTELMPGRRGGEDNNPLDKILLPMKFSEFVKLLKPEIKEKLFDLDLAKNSSRHRKIFKLFEGKIDSTIEKLSFMKKELDSLLEMYLFTGGIPATINEYNEKGKISTNLFNVYINSIIGDLRRFNYKEHYVKQIIREVLITLSTPISWNNISKNTEVKTHNTVQDYITALEELYVANISYKCSIHDKKIHFAMKKIYIQDPFIFHALDGWTNGKKDYFTNAKKNVLSMEIKSRLVESVVYNHLCRLSFCLNPRDLFDPKDNICYYRDKKDKEVDFVMLHDEKMYPFEVKYQSSISPSDFFCFKSFKKGVLLTKNELGIYRDYVKVPVSIFLLLI
jgi:uncharacterized protein